MNNLILFGDGMDQSLPTEEEFAEVRSRVDRTVADAIEAADLDQATNLVRTLVKIAKISGRELARVLYQFSSHWSVFKSEETFEEWAFRESGLHPHTIERYVRVESLLTRPDIPIAVRKELSDRNMAELFPVANMIEQGYEPTEDQWHKLLLQPDDSSIRGVVREIKGSDPRPTALVIRIDENGSIWAVKDGVRKFAGSLEIKDESPIVQQAIDRIIKNTGMLR